MHKQLACYIQTKSVKYHSTETLWNESMNVSHLLKYNFFSCIIKYRQKIFSIECKLQIRIQKQLEHLLILIIHQKHYKM